MAAISPGRTGGGHPLLGLALWRPQLLVDHASACAELAMAEAELALRLWRRQALWTALAAAGLVLAAALAGTALMLWAALPTGSLPRPHWLWLVPLPPLLLGLVAVALAQRPTGAVFGHLRHQLGADLQRLREAASAAPAP